MKIKAEGTPGVVVLDNFDVSYNDGQWRRVMFIIMQNRMELSVDGVPMQTVRIISVISGKFFFIGGEWW